MPSTPIGIGLSLAYTFPCAGNCAGTRTAAAKALIKYLNSDPTNSGDTDIISMGACSLCRTQTGPCCSLQNPEYILTSRLGSSNYK